MFILIVGLEIILFLFLSSILFLFFSSVNLLNVLILMELIWINFFIYIAIFSSRVDSFFLFLLSLFALCLATIETCVGLSILLFKSAISAASLLGVNRTHSYFLRKAFRNTINDKA